MMENNTEWKVAPSFQNATIVKVDEENHKAYITETCERCGGSGAFVIPGIFSGTCFKCNGAGRLAKWVKAYTPAEYDKYTKAQERAKEKRREKEEERIQSLKDSSEENKKELLDKFGYDIDNPIVYIIGGENTYAIKDIIKERGGHYNAAFGWFFTKKTEIPEGYTLLPIGFDEVYNWNPLSKSIDIKEDAKENVDKLKMSILPPSESEYIGEVKERMRDLRVTLTGARAVSSAYGTSILFTFEYNKNILVWFTSCPPDEEDAVVGKEYLLTGTVKEHKEYKGVKQTYLNRCKLKNL